MQDSPRFQEPGILPEDDAERVIDSPPVLGICWDSGGMGGGGQDTVHQSGNLLYFLDDSGCFGPFPTIDALIQKCLSEDATPRITINDSFLHVWSRLHPTNELVARVNAVGCSSGHRIMVNDQPFEVTDGVLHDLVGTRLGCPFCRSE